MKGLNNNEQSVQTLKNLKGSLINRVHEIYNQGYQEGFKDGQTDMAQTLLGGMRDMLLDTQAVGDCNFCRFAGCSECDDCINGSQWVLMTKEDEE